MRETWQSIGLLDLFVLGCELFAALSTSRPSKDPPRVSRHQFEILPLLLRREERESVFASFPLPQSESAGLVRAGRGRKGFSATSGHREAASLDPGGTKGLGTMRRFMT
jgi:hypothetical protein